MIAGERGQETASVLCYREIEGCLETLEECGAMVQALGSDGLCAAPAGPESSIGAHLRHAVEHYLCFLRGLPTGEIDYDNRDRDRDLERCPETVRKTLDAIRRELTALGESASDRPLLLRTLPSRHGDAVQIETTLRRELVFLANHTIHHLALIRVLAQVAGCNTTPEVGLAFSTARFREAEKR